MVMIERTTFLHAVQKRNQLVSISSAMFLLNVLCGAQLEKLLLCKKLICFAMWFTIVHVCILLHVSKKISLRVTRIKHGISLDMAIETVHSTMSLVPDFSLNNCIYSNCTTPKANTPFQCMLISTKASALCNVNQNLLEPYRWTHYPPTSISFMLQTKFKNSTK